jgi:Protein of unknown function (DUF3501)
MKLELPIAPHNLMMTTDYVTWRELNKKQLMAHRQLRSVRLGDHLLLQFESELTVRYQIQEMLRIEKLTETADIEHEIEAYAPLVPSGTNWICTLMIQYTDATQAQKALTELVGIEDRIYIQVEDFDCVYAVADEDLSRQRTNKTSAVHFLRFELSEAMRLAIHGGAAVTLGCDHQRYMVKTQFSSIVLDSLKSELKG